MPDESGYAVLELSIKVERDFAIVLKVDVET